MSFLKSLWTGKASERAHSFLTRFGKGSFPGRAVLSARLNERVKANSTFEYATDFVTFLASLARKVTASGKILAKSDISAELKRLGIEAKTEKAARVFSYSFSGTLTSEQASGLEKVAYYLLLDCSAKGVSLKTKKKLPTVRVTGKGLPKPDEHFCQLTLEKSYWPAFRDSFFFDLPGGKKLRVEYTFVIEDFEFPGGKYGYEELRELAKRRGRLVRKAVIDGKEFVSEKRFLA